MKIIVQHLRKLTVFIVIFCLAAFVLAGCAMFEPEVPKTDVLPEDTFCNGITVNGTNISGMTYDQGLSAVKASIVKPQGTILVINGEAKTELNAELIAVIDNVENVLKEAIKLGNTGLKKEIAAEREKLETEGIKLPIEIKYDAEPLKPEAVRAAQELSYPAKDASAKFNIDLPEKFEFTSAEKGCTIDADALFALVKESVEAGNINDSVLAPAVVVEPAITDEQVRMSNSLIASFTTSFKKSPYNEKNRVHNITKAAGIFNGFMLNPGDEFDFNKVLGPRSVATGWKEAGAIVAGKKELESGGGICQVSSTLYNSVLIAELEILQRTPHSWPLSYITIGQDATVSYGGPNFRFKNNKDTPVILVTNIDKEAFTITVSIYGKAREDGMEIKFTSKRTSSIAQPPDRVTVDPTLLPGTVVVEREGRGGSRSRTMKEYYKDGVLVSSEVHHEDYYPPIASIIFVGPELSTVPPVTYMPAPTF